MLLEVGRTALEPGNITKGDILQAFPFQNTFDLVTLPGSTLRKVFERSVADLSQRGPHDSGEFLQVSGFKLIYDLRLSPGSRLVEAQVQSSDKGYERLKDGQEYHVVMSDYISRGGDGYKMIKEEKLNQRQGFLDFDQILTYLKLFSPVSPRIQGRIVMKGEIPEEPASTNDANGNRVLSETLIQICFVISNIFLLS
ncbi:5'-nucleotidase [Eurytemora carolleeae]|uniref:5'-nucleotidase n=1 Tax=Eurytemora carolleeae TaxID=1294199 RepID=UPI000C75EDF4|nr:5'-nucleotidase [Eurytemora carolleeae]|eukprot:XP_023341949.1 5'-nucleotidase-like [Eurytemora affinis]